MRVHYTSTRNNALSNTMILTLPHLTLPSGQTVFRLSSAEAIHND